MKVENINIGYKEVEQIKYDSLNEFYKYICDTPFNNAFRWARHGSVDNDKSFTHTDSFEEAVDLMKNGWTDMAQKLTKKLKDIETEMVPMTKRKSVYDVAGYQCSVPRYLNGIPTSMIRTINAPAKQKVVNLVKSIDYSGSVSVDKMLEESIKAMQIVKKLENQGYRINLDIMLGSTQSYDGFIIRIRIKNASERLNISKLAFPLVHPSMLRRLLFRWIEVYPKITKEYVSGYGRPLSNEDGRKAINKGEIFIPSIIRKDMSKINTLDDLENL